MILYAESSAILAWLLDEPTAARIKDLLAQAQAIVASSLTVLECERALVRSVINGRLREAQAGAERSRLHHSAAHWTLMPVNSHILERAGQRFPVEPLRTLDAVHLASALVARESKPEIALLTLDNRVKDCGLQLGFDIHPG